MFCSVVLVEGGQIIRFLHSVVGMFSFLLLLAPRHYTADMVSREAKQCVPIKLSPEGHTPQCVHRQLLSDGVSMTTAHF